MKNCDGKNLIQWILMEIKYKTIWLQLITLYMGTIAIINTISHTHTHTHTYYIIFIISIILIIYNNNTYVYLIRYGKIFKNYLSNYNVNK